MLGVNVRKQCGSTAAKRQRMSLEVSSPSCWIIGAISVEVADLRVIDGG
jgi:hypothetical protein